MAYSDDNSFDITDPGSWPDGSRMGNERDLADSISDDVLAWFSDVNDYQNIDLDDDFIHAYFMLLIMDEAVFLGATGQTTPGPVQDMKRALRNTIRDDPYEDTGYYFTLRLRQRLEEGG